MTTTPLPAASGFSPFAAVHRHWRLVAFLLVGIAPFLPSIVAMREFLLADNALAFVPAMLPLAAYLLWRNAHSEQAPTKRDVLVDLFFIVPLIIGASFVLFITPARLSWYFWLNRVDLLALPLWVTATGIAFFGYQQVLRTWPAFLVLWLAWPYPVVWLQRVTTGPFVDVTAAVAGVLVEFLRLPYSIDAADRTMFVTTHLPEGENFVLVLGQHYSGAAATIGFLLVGGVLTLLMRGSGWRRLGWLVAGVALAFLSNLVRVGVLLTLATSHSREFAVDEVHPVLGVALFVLVLAVMLALIRPFGLRLTPGWRGRRLAWEPVDGGGGTLRLLWVALVAGAVGIGWGVAEAQRYHFIGIGDGAPAISLQSTDTILPAVEGWELEHVSVMSWTDLFGRTSRGDVWTYAAAGWQEGDPRVEVQTVIVDDRSTLDRYTIEQHIDFHGRDVGARLAVDLGYGVTGVVIHDTPEGVPASFLTWTIPVNVDGDLRHARITLSGDVETFTRVIGDPAAMGASPATARLGRTVENALSALPTTAPGDRRETLDRGLVLLAASIVDTLVTTGGPGLNVELETPSVEPTPALVPLGDLGAPTDTPTPGSQP